VVRHPCEESGAARSALRHRTVTDRSGRNWHRWQEEACGARYLLVALPRPASQRRVFRPARRVNWGTRVFAFLVLLLAMGAIGAFLEVMLPQQVAKLAQMEASELGLARKGTTNVNTSVTALWADVSPKGSMSLTDDRIAADLALSQRTEKAAADALGHVQAAEAYMAQADGLPFQFHPPAFIATDQLALQHLEKGLGAAVKLAHGATLQLTLAKHASQDSRTLVQLNVDVDARAWADAASIASTLVTNLRSQQVPVADPEALLDPLWGKWVDAMVAVTVDAQQLSLHSAANQAPLAQQDSRALAAARAQLPASYAAAQNGAPAWQAKTIQPLLDTLTTELAAGS
jgi:hypothetical protein